MEDRPRLRDAVVLAFQHALLALVFLVYPLAAAQQIGLSASDTGKFLTAVILSIGVATCLHGFRTPIGSGALAVEIPTPAFLPTAVLAGSTGGLSMLAGMSLVSGFVELLFAGMLRRLRALFPAEVCGVAVVMLGLTLVRPGMLNVLPHGSVTGQNGAASLAVASLTIATITLLAIYADARLKLLALGGGLVAGIALASLLGMTPGSYWAPLLQSSWAGLPAIDIAKARFTPDLLPLCVMIALVLGIDNVGMLIGIQRQLDPAWTRMDMRQAGSGIRVSAIGDLLAGLLGGMPTGISSANISLSHATGAIARRISFATGALLLAAAFSPKAVTAVSLIPKPVIGAVMLHAAAYMLVSGMTLFLGRLLNEKRIFVVGFSIVAGLGPVVVPDLFSEAPALLRPILESPLAVGSFSAILLTQLLRIDVAEVVRVTVVLPDSRNEMVHELVCNKAIRADLVRLGATAGAARPAIYRAIDVTAECVGWLKANGYIDGDIRLTATVRDTRLDIDLDYDGRPALAQDGATDAGRPQPAGTAAQGQALESLRASVDHFTARSSGLNQHLRLGFGHSH